MSEDNLVVSFENAYIIPRIVYRLLGAKTTVVTVEQRNQENTTAKRHGMRSRVKKLLWLRAARVISDSDAANDFSDSAICTTAIELFGLFCSRSQQNR